jgi:2,4-didehydro-3-deoxy-L-rhamnonate hydrolase
MMHRAQDRFSLGTFAQDGQRPFAGMVLHGEGSPAVIALNDLLALDTPSRSHDLTSIFALFDDWNAKFAHLRRLHARLDSAAGAKVCRFALERLRTLAPYRPQQIVCIGANYRTHVIEMLAAQPSPHMLSFAPEERRAEAARMMDERAARGDPYAFSKLPSCVIGSGDPVVLPYDVDKPDWELELAVVIGAPARRVSRADAMRCVAGFTIANDITARERIYRSDLPDLASDFLAGKSVPTFLPFGPWITPSEFVDHEDLTITLSLNGERMQHGHTSDMVFDIPRQIEYLSSRIELLPGDLICTGSPAGNGMHHGRFLRPGDQLSGTITGLGTLLNPCVAESGVSR